MERNIFAYVDVIVIVRRKKKTQLQDLGETFASMRRAQLKLNTDKCVFGVSRCKVLGYLVSVNVIPGFKAKLSTHSMCAQGSSLHTCGIENGYRITHVTIYNIYYRIMSL
jgi:hypothetical protein